MSVTVEVIETANGWLYVDREGSVFSLLIINTNGEKANIHLGDAAALRAVGAALVEFAERYTPVGPG